MRSPRYTFAVVVPLTALVLAGCSGNDTTGTSAAPTTPSPGASSAPAETGAPTPDGTPPPATTIPAAPDPMIEALIAMMAAQAKVQNAESEFTTDLDTLEKVGGWKRPDGDFEFKVERVDNKAARVCMSAKNTDTGMTMVYDSNGTLAEAADGDCRSGFKD